MDRTIVVLLLLLLGGYSVVLSGLNYEVISIPRPDEYFTRDEITVDQVINRSNSNAPLYRSEESQDTNSKN